MPQKYPVTMENAALKVQVDARDLAVVVTVKQTGETLRMAPAQDDDVLMVRGQSQEWRSFAASPIAIRQQGPQGIAADLPGIALQVQIALEGPELLFKIAPLETPDGQVARDVLYPRHFLLPAAADAYAVFPLGQGCIIRATDATTFHHREGYSEPTVSWLGGYTGQTGYCAIAETPDDFYQAIDNRPGQPASAFFHWLGSLGALRYPRRVRYHFADGLTYVRQAKLYREYCKKIGLFRSLEDKAAENPNVAKLHAAPLVSVLASIRREKTFTYESNDFSELARWVEEFRKQTRITNALVHVDGWGYWGYDSMHPDVLPPNPDCGGIDGLADLARRVKGLGYLFALHDQYIDMYAHAPSYDERLSIVTEDGRGVRVNRWAGGLCSHMCYSQIPRFLKRNLLEGVRRVYPMYHNSPGIWDICAPTAYYLDCFCRTVECWSKEHPATRSQMREYQRECFRMVRGGRDGAPDGAHRRAPQGLRRALHRQRLEQQPHQHGRTDGIRRDGLPRRGHPRAAVAPGLSRRGAPADARRRADRSHALRPGAALPAHRALHPAGRTAAQEDRPGLPPGRGPLGDDPPRGP